MLKLEFNLENETFYLKQGCFFRLTIVSTLYSFYGLKFDTITNQVIIGYFASFLVKSLCLKRLYNFYLPLCLITINRLL